jgi:hypothetical protein
MGAALADDHAYQRLSELCDGIGNRLSGSENLDRAVAWAAAAMREDGLANVRLQPVMIPHWVRGDEHAEIVFPHTEPLAMLGLGRSVATPPGGITARVVVVTSFDALDSLPADQVRGRIVLYDVPFTRYGETVRYRTNGAEHAARRGAVAALVRTVGPASLRSPHTGAMAAYGDTLPLDSWDVGQGAQDDGAGCALAMETVRLMQRLGLHPRRTVRCVLWVNEENGGRGARAYADSLHGDVSRHVAAIESDGGAERPLGFLLGVHRVGSETTDSTRLAAGLTRLREIAPLFTGLGADHMADGGGEADIGPLMTMGVPGVSHRTVGEHYFDWHHSRADMLDKVDPVELRRNLAALAAFVYLVADDPEPLAGRLPTATHAPPLGTH